MYLSARRSSGEAAGGRPGTRSGPGGRSESAENSAVGDGPTAGSALGLGYANLPQRCDVASPPTRFGSRAPRTCQPRLAARIGRPALFGATCLAEEESVPGCVQRLGSGVSAETPPTLERLPLRPTGGASPGGSRGIAELRSRPPGLPSQDRSEIARGPLAKVGLPYAILPSVTGFPSVSKLWKIQYS